MKTLSIYFLLNIFFSVAVQAGVKTGGELPDLKKPIGEFGCSGDSAYFRALDIVGINVGPFKSGKVEIRDVQVSDRFEDLEYVEFNPKDRKAYKVTWGFKGETEDESLFIRLSHYIILGLATCRVESFDAGPLKTTY